MRAQTVPNDPQSETHNVYFVYCAGFVKIGSTNRLVRRLSEMQIGNPFKSQAILLIPGGRLTEQYMHFLFQADHYRGEWFRLGQKLREIIAERAPEECQQWLIEEEAAHRERVLAEAASLHG